MNDLSEDAERLTQALDVSIARGVADAGRVHDLDEVCDDLDARYAQMVAPLGELP